MLSKLNIGKQAHIYDYREAQHTSTQFITMQLSLTSNYEFGGLEKSAFNVEQWFEMLGGKKLKFQTQNQRAKSNKMPKYRKYKVWLWLYEVKTERMQKSLKL